jgi:tryptophan synthase beta chain
MHQTVIGEESIKQMELAGDTPDVLIGCTGGGSNFGGFTFPFLREKIAGSIDPRVIAVEPAAAPSLTRGSYQFDFGDTAGMTPLVKMHTLGHDFVPDPIHAGGLRYHGMAPLVSLLKEEGLIEAQAKHQTETFAAATRFSRTEGILPAPEPSHAIAAAIAEAEAAKESGEEKVILFNLCGHGHFDMGAYNAHHAGELVDYEYPEDKVAAAMARVPQVDA